MTPPAALNTPRPPRVLIVDDEAANLTALRSTLSQHGYETEGFVDPAEALASIKRGAFDLLLADLMMPGMSGVDLMRAAQERDPDLVGVIMTGEGTIATAVEAMRTGALDYILKPLKLSVVLPVLSRALTVRSLRIENAELTRSVRERTAELEVARAEAKFRLAMDAARMGEIAVDLRSEQVVHTPAFAKLLGYPADRRLSLAEIRECWHPEDRALIIQERDAAIASGAVSFETEYRIVWPDGTTKWLTGRGQIIRDASGRAIEANVIYMDITERKWVEEKQNLLLAELNHRVKNTLAAVQSIALLSRLDAPTPELFGQRFEARLAALAGAHDLLTRASWEGASLADAVSRTLAPYVQAGDGAKRITIEGPMVQLSPNAAVTLHMAFHELATNAAKYGALSASEGKLDVRWSIDRTSTPAMVEFVWTERGGPTVAPPRRRGFGLKLIEQGLERELDGAATVRFDPEGVVCLLRLPASAKVAPL
ncbi:MAG: HWE histidine kinase domain-containing protein [Hyphomonadaceae bacterium]|nr:HWE histidine kinase domain-containing protein [Hyphomonadaceae bacterium]